ncbi:MAG: hypothetical protein KAG89_12165 [Fulvimarina manganoxydans]|uniref:hypothetical protein n=1 Tax=Fulvimarina manganoxydans TaxID=937218 RepID=UPI00235583AA|nr:hypothetical protein [Fulvimarina manganoxydans]MCK5932913.1 hypothetical protein [Fulvimarina manganoxydans]
MSTAVLNLRVMPRRMLTVSEAANYCGRSLKVFKAECPVAPIAFSNGDQRFDMVDLDKWIDGLKDGTSDDADAIISRLGA